MTIATFAVAAALVVARRRPAAVYLLLVRALALLTTTGLKVAVDVCNVVSLHSGLPISVVDLDRAREPFRVSVAPPGASYVFNASGQTIDIGGLLCLGDADGPCANAVKDAQRTKTDANTTQTLTVIWGTIPYVLCMFLAIAILCVFPEIATWLPDTLMGAVRTK